MKYSCGNEVEVGDTVIRIKDPLGLLKTGGEHIVTALGQYQTIRVADSLLTSLCPQSFVLIKRKPKLIWKEMTRDEVKAVQVGDKIRIDGVEHVVKRLYDRPYDFGFYTDKNLISDSSVEDMDYKFEHLVEEIEMNTGLERDKEYDVKLTGEEIAIVNMLLCNCTGHHVTSVWRKFYSLVGHHLVDIDTIYLHNVKDALDNYLDKLFPKIETEDQRKLRELKEQYSELGKAIEAMENK